MRRIDLIKLRIRNLSINIILFIVVLIILFIPLEIFSHIYLANEFPVIASERDKAYFNGEFMLYHENECFEWVESEFKLVHCTNNEGFLDDNQTYTKDPDKTTVMFLGDSFTEAVQIDRENRFDYQLRDKGEFDTINLGHGGMGISYYYEIYKKIGSRYESDYVFVLIFPYNDITNSYPTLEEEYNKPYYTLDDGELNRQIDVKKRPFLDKLAEHSLFFSFIDKSLLFLKHRDTGPENSNEALIYCANPPNSEEYQRAWAVTERLLRELNKEIEQNNSKMIPIIIEPRQTLVDEHWKPIKDLPYNCSRDYPNKKLKQIFVNNNIDYIELEESFSENSTDLFFEIDMHWNERGHELAAEEIYNYLEQNAV